MCSQQRLSGLAHRFDIQPLIDVPDVAAVKQVASAAILDDVAVALAEGVALSVEAGGGFQHFKYEHVFGQLSIQGLRQRSRRQAGGRVEAHDLAESMHASVCTAT